MDTARASAEEYFYAGTHLIGEGEALEAEHALRHALRLAPDMAEAHANLGWLLEQQCRWQEAEDHYRQALAMQPQQLQTLINFGAFLTAQKRFDEAEAVYHHALKVAPDSAVALSNLGVLLACVKREEEAERAHRAAIESAPDYRKARFNLAYLLLRQGRYEEGWACLEAREWNAPFEEHFHFPRWNGETLAGKSLLIAIEGGHGDMIQFCRYARLAKKNGARRISILCHPALKNLLTSVRDIDEVFGTDEEWPPMQWDYWVMPLSLPFLFQSGRDTIPAELPYVYAEPARIARWRECIPHQPQVLRVGLAWKGNASFENDADRSLPALDVLAPLAAVPGIHFFSLQKGAGEKESLLNSALALLDLAPQIDDFADTAAIIMHLDLVIAVDTAVAHLAGALGKPCWLLLPAYKADWRWLGEGSETPWYPQVMRLFRQQHAGDWRPVIAQLAAALRAWP